MKTMNEVYDDCEDGANAFRCELKDTIIEDVKVWKGHLPEGCWLFIEKRERGNTFIFESDFATENRIYSLITNIAYCVHKYDLTDEDFK